MEIFFFPSFKLYKLFILQWKDLQYLALLLHSFVLIERNSRAHESRARRRGGGGMKMTVDRLQPVIALYCYRARHFDYSLNESFFFILLL